MHRSRWMSDGAQQRRDTWYNELQIEDKSSLLFQFEILLKGVVSLGNVQNFPGSKTSVSLDARNFAPELTMLLQTVEDLVEIGEQLSSQSAGAAVAYTIDVLSEKIVDDYLRIDHMEQTLLQETPDRSLFLLLSTFQMAQVLGAQALQKDHVEYRDFIAVHTVIFKEVMRSKYFNMLTLFEFRPQYDGILRHQVLLTLESIEHEAAQRITAISLLTIFRLMNYLDVTARWEAGQHTGSLYALLCLINSDANQFSQFLARDTAHWLSTDFGTEYETLLPEQLTERFDDLNLQFQELKSLRELLESTGDQLDLELKKTFGQQLPTIEELTRPEEVLGAVQSACGSLQSFLQNAAVLLVQEFNVSVEGDDLFEDFTSDATRSARLRRDIWMFRQILKAFVAKTRGTESVRDRWKGINTFKFVRTFVAYFRSMGYQLLRYSDYERFDKFMALVDRLRDGDVLEVQRLSSVVEECEAFYQYLEKMFDSVSRRKELQDISFDTKDAAQTLKLFIAE